MTLEGADFGMRNAENFMCRMCQYIQIPATFVAFIFFPASMEICHVVPG
jgi:hypothetical protein